MSGINDLYPTTAGMTDAEVTARQAASRVATVTPRPLDPTDPWDVSGPRRPARLLVSVEDLTAEQWQQRSVIPPPDLGVWGFGEA